jgi:hypothetical protein
MLLSPRDYIQGGYDSHSTVTVSPWRSEVKAKTAPHRAV